MRGRSALLLCVVLAALVVYVLRFERGKPSDAEEAARSLELFRLTPAFITQIAIAAGPDSVLLRRTDEGQWMMLRPVSDRADNDRVRSFLELFAPLSATERVAGGRGQAIKYRLDRPIAVVSFTEPRGHAFETRTLRVGRENPALDGYYCEAAGDSSRIGLVDARLVETYLLRGMDEFRQRHLLTFRAEDVVELSVQHGGEPIVIRRDARREWVVVSPEWAWPRQGVVNVLLTRFRELRKDAFVDDRPAALSDYGLDPPALRLTAVLEDQTRRNVRVGRPTPDGGYFANRDRDPRVFQVSDASVDALDVTLAELRAPTLIDAAADHVTGLRIEAAGEALEAVRGPDGGWTTVDGAALERAPMDEVLVACRALPIERYDDSADAATGWDRPDARLNIRLVDGDTHQLVFRAGPPARARVVPVANVGQARAPMSAVAVVNGDVVERLVSVASSPPEAP